MVCDQYLPVGCPCSAAQDPSVKDSNQDWSLCMNGTRNEGAVKGAVDEFAQEHGLQILVRHSLSAAASSHRWQAPLQRGAKSNMGLQCLRAGDV